MSEKQIGWKFDNTYPKLPSIMLSKIKPTPVKNPKIIILNNDLSKEIGLDFSKVNKNELALIFSGNKLPKGSEAISQAYAGHQFGHFTILGDGRAHIIGEHITNQKKRFDIQFKGSGPTPYSRNADGRAALGPMLREYLISESMHNLGIPTTRSLAVIKTGENVIRETNLEGAILTRVASSHIRVGTFQFALISEDTNHLKSLFNYTIKRHYPNLLKSKNSAIELLQSVLEKQIDLICHWMRVGFVHGVMNTDNMTISGETIDYGPCAFLDNYDPGTVFSSIDKYGRYAYYNQPRIAKWNLERFAECLLPLINQDNKKAVGIATEVLGEFPNKYKKKWLEMMRKKLGFAGEEKIDEELIVELLTWMHKNNADYTNTFCYLMENLKVDSNVFQDEQFKIWKKKWVDRSQLNNNTFKNRLNMMKKANPLVIPRNYHVEEALKNAVENNDLNKFNNLVNVIKNNNCDATTLSLFQSPGQSDKKYVTYCGT